jgi:hypothetical protein
MIYYRRITTLRPDICLALLIISRHEERRKAQECLASAMLAAALKETSDG